jgi:hypothetical protein
MGVFTKNLGAERNSSIPIKHGPPIGKTNTRDKE